MSESPTKIIPRRRVTTDKRHWPSPTEDLVEIPAERRHDSGTAATVGGILLSGALATVGGAALGAGYGAVIALNAEKLVNLSLALSFPFWMHAPAQLGFWWTHLRDRKWRFRIGLIGFIVCFYAVCVGWLAAVLDGPGLVFDPLRLAGHLSDVSNYGFWLLGFELGLEHELHSLAPVLLTLRFGGLLWIFFGGFLSLGAATPYPYCPNCKRWMDDTATLRLRYDPPSTKHAHVLASALVNGRYDALFALDQPVAEKEKGLELSVFACEGCRRRHVLNVKWYRPTPDPEKNDTEQLLEAGTGRRLVSGLIVPAEVHAHIAQLAKTNAKSKAKAA